MRLIWYWKNIKVIIAQKKQKENSFPPESEIFRNFTDFTREHILTTDAHPI